MFAEMGFDALFFGRIDYQDKEKRMNDKALEWIWTPNSESLGEETNIFAQLMWDSYENPNFDWDISKDCCDPWINEEGTEVYNAPEWADKLMQDIDNRAQHYLTDEIFVVFGGDFEYVNALQNYYSMDNMISYMNEHHSDKFHFRYSTPSDYVDAIAKKKVEWPTKSDDLFPYADSPDAYWTGYFSSRANDKQYIRRASSNFHASSQLFSQKVLSQVSDSQEI